MPASAMHRTTVLSSVADAPEGARVARCGDRYTGISTHRLQCGACGFDVATGVDPYLYPVMFEGASHIQCSQCESINALPIDL